MPIRVLVVDDSALIRQVLSELLSQAPDLEVIGTAADPYIAREKIKSLRPDVLTLDIEMPRMDGLTFLDRLMALHPMPVVILSTLTTHGADTALRALQLGAVDYVAKPTENLSRGLVSLQAELVGKIRAAATARVGMTRSRVEVTARFSDKRGSKVIVAIGASTGGVEALHAVLTALPPDSPPILITQHMPPGFTTSFARRLNNVCAVTVSEAQDEQLVEPGNVYLANGAYHLELLNRHAAWVCRLHTGPPLSGHRPSVDTLFQSVAKVAGPRAVGVIMTGMGRDGADGLLALRQAGARTLGQDEATCLVYGMPNAAKIAGAVERELPLHRIPQGILNAASEISGATP